MNYQPQVDLRTGRVQRVEALVRWQHPERGLIPPNQFINLAERTGLMKSVTEWVVGEAARQSAEWHARGVEIVVTVNLSAENLHDPDLLPMIRDSLSAHGADPTSFGVEITETSIMRQPDHALRIIQELNDLGVRIAIDDFGTGYSSLGYLKRFPAHELKIDRSFVKDMREDGNDAIIVGAIIDLGHKLGLDVLAEESRTRKHLTVSLWPAVTSFRATTSAARSARLTSRNGSAIHLRRSQQQNLSARRHLYETDISADCWPSTCHSPRIPVLTS
jgi:EAL domain-containing protein (putative c-di-GMP-specific phosphodiesterase class I)